MSQEVAKSEYCWFRFMICPYFKILFSSLLFICVHTHNKNNDLLFMNYFQL